MRIVVVGAPSVGKTTLAKALIESLPSYKVLPEGARLAIEVGYKLDETATIETELWLILKQLELERTEGNWVADRCAIDLLSYIIYLFPNEKELIEFAHRILQPNFYKYDLIVYLPTNQFPIENDGIRNTDSDFQNAIDQGIMYTLQHYRLPFVEIVGTPEERLKKVRARIKLFLDDANDDQAKIE